MSVAIGQVVLDPDLDLVADLEVDHRGRDHAVVGPRLDDLARARPPSRRAPSSRSNTLVPSAFTSVGSRSWLPDALGLGRERRHGVEHVGGHLVVVHLTVGGVLALRRGRSGGAASLGDGERRRHAGVGVAADLAQQLVAPGLQRREVELTRLAGGQVGGLQIGVDHPQVVGGRTVVGHVQRPTAGHVDSARGDGELGEGHVHVAGLGACSRRRQRRREQRSTSRPPAQGRRWSRRSAARSSRRVTERARRGPARQVRWAQGLQRGREERVHRAAPTGRSGRGAGPVRQGRRSQPDGFETQGSPRSGQQHLEGAGRARRRRRCRRRPSCRRAGSGG